MSELWGGRRAPVTLLGGYLGSGKTTLLNELLASADRRYAVLVNDIGAINVDAALIARRDGDTIELSDGCVCCSLVDGFALAFESLRERPDPPDHVLVELSGVADPARVAPFTGTQGFALDSILVCFDLDQGVERARDRWSGDTVERQLLAADLLVLTKRDLVAADGARAARDYLAELAPGTPSVLADRGRLPPDWLAPARRTGPRAAPAPSHIAHEHHHVVNVEVAAATQRQELERWLQALPQQVVRVKGVVFSPSGPLLVEGVGRRRRIREAPGDIAPLAGSELAPDSGRRVGSGVESGSLGTLVLIATSDLDPAELTPPRAR